MTATARLPQFAATLDAKRIAATSVAIAVHAAVLMMLLMPTQVADPPKVTEQDFILVPETKKIEPIPPPLPPRHEVRHVTHETPPPQREVAVEVINTDPSPVDPFVERVTLDEQPEAILQVDPQPAFAQIQADIAPPPVYPAQALRMRQAGRVMLRVRVDAQGQPLEVEVESSSGFRVLDEAAIKVVKKRWHFVPATQDGQPIAAWALVPIVFQIAG